MKADFLREKFLGFFKAKNHKIVESDSLVPKNDPTVLFTPAGMNQFKKEFLGFDSGFKRAATAQRCLRTDDLDKVGKTSAHHTFFEMLGNFSFGDYFKEDAISWAWEFLVKELSLDPEKLWVSVYQEDDEAYNIWKNKIGVPVGKIVKLGDKDNFWPAEAKTKGPNGPCGPCSEIFYDFGAGVGCKKKTCNPACSCGRFVEIWNLVFTQFNRKEDSSLEPLPNKNIDTGMGLERLTAVIQGKQNNFGTELFRPIIEEIERCAELNPEDKNKLLYAVADHARAVVFSIYDGIFPSNDGRGYIVRKIIRKSVLHLRSLGINKPFLYKLSGVVAQIMHNPYPDLKNRHEDIAQVILNEENKFINTLKDASRIIKHVVINYVLLAKDTGSKMDIGRVAFELYDTYGIPLEVTKEWLDKHASEVAKEWSDAWNISQKDFEKDFEKAMQEQKARSKSGSVMKGDVFGAKGLGLKLDATKFIGYKENFAETKILAILKDGKTVNEALTGNSLEIILDQTPFYAESGGQVGDIGELVNGKNIFEVLDTQKIDGVILHIGRVKSGVFKAHDILTAKINIGHRLNIARNHTATHLLQAALRKVLGNHVQQQGSLVSEEKLRFDFTHFKGLSHEEISRIEELANSYILNNGKVNCQQMSLIEAKEVGALAFFEEKYGENVRVVSVSDISKELCGGTHLDNVGKIGLIKITSESSVASGIRRIEAVTADLAEKFIEEEKQKEINENAKKNKLEELKQQEKERNAELNKSLKDILPQLLEKRAKLKDINVVFSFEENLDINTLRTLADMVKTKLSNAVIALGSQDKELKKAFLIIAVTSDLLSKGLDAGKLVREVSGEIGGSGGGRKDFAQAGGTKLGNFNLVFSKLRDIISNSL